jgi:energy-coupling factor transporter ATP-binding protein EcfA2
MDLIELRNVSFSYGESSEKALDSVSLSVEKGEFIGVIGGTGEGKTTLALCFNGLIPQMVKGSFSGKVLVDRLDTSDTPVSKLAPKVGLVFQEPDDQIFAIDVREEIKFGPSNLGLGEKAVKKRVEQAAELVGITPLLNRDTTSLSQGQKQLICIASVLAMNPDIIVLDEPTAEVDYKSARKIYEVLHALKKDGKTVIVVEHRTGFLAEHASRVLVMEKGRIVRDGAPSETFSDVTFLEGLGLEVPPMQKLRHELAKKGRPLSFSTMKEAVKELSAK